MSIILSNISSGLEGESNGKPPLFNVNKLLKNYNLDRNSLQLQSIESDDGSLSSVDSNTKHVAIEPGTTLYLQANTETNNDPIIFFADGTTRKVGQMIAGQNNIQWSISGGKDQDLFLIDQDSGVLEFVDVPVDPESGSDQYSDVMYDLVLKASGADGSTEQIVNIKMA